MSLGVAQGCSAASFTASPRRPATWWVPSRHMPVDGRETELSGVPGENQTPGASAGETGPTLLPLSSFNGRQASTPPAPWQGHQSVT